MWSGGVGGVGGWFSQKIIPLRGPILQAEACQRFSAELRFQDRAECGNICVFTVWDLVVPIYQIEKFF